MTSALVQIPLAAGAGAASLAGRAVAWGAGQFARSPMASTGLILASGLMLMAATNAMFFQDGRHPAPLFVTGSTAAIIDIPEPIRPVVVEPQTIPERPVEELAVATPQPVAAASEAAAPAIGNQDIADLQEKLRALGLFNGDVDGYYGPRTADAIRAFESRFGLPRTGAATPQVIDAVRKAQVQAPQATAPIPTVAAEPPVDEIAPLIAEMRGEAAPVETTPERETIADISPDLPVSTPTAEPSGPAVLNGDLVSDIQRGLTRLGFLQGPINGVADEATARAIRQFQIFNNYRPTGEVSATLRQMLVEAGAYL